jgi:hypothetical protein
MLKGQNRSQITSALAAVTRAENMGLRTFAFLAMLILPGAAQAEWLRVGTSVTGAAYYMDGERMRTVNGKRQTWVKVDHAKDSSVTYRESMSLFSFDCGKQTYKLLHISQTDSYGKHVASRNIPDSALGIGYEPIVPETIAEMISKIACAYQSGG